MKAYRYILVICGLLVGYKPAMAQTIVLSQNFEGNVWTPTAYVIGTTTGAWTSIPDGTPANTPAGGQSWYGNGYAGYPANNLWHRSDYQGAWTTNYNTCAGIYPPPACGANGTNHSLIFDNYDGAGGSYGGIQSNAMDLSPYCAANVSFYYCNYNTGASSLEVDFWNGSAWVAATTVFTTASNLWTQVTATVPTACLIASTDMLITAFDGGTYPIGIDEIVVTGNPIGANDNCACATTITMTPMAITNSYSGTATGDNSSATADGVNGKCFTNFNNVWYNFTAPVTGNYFVEVTAGTMTYPKLSLLKGTCGSFTELDCAGEYSGTVYDSWGTPGTTSPFGYSPYSTYGNSYTTAQACQVTAGTVITINVDSYSALGTFTVNVTTLKNDDIAQPLIINSCGMNFAGSTIGGTNCGSGAGAGNKYYNNVDNNATVCNGSAGASGGFTPCNGTAGSGENATACVTGGDVGFGVENDTWFELCVTASSTLTLTFTPDMASCLPVPSPTNGLQIALFTQVTAPPSLSLAKIDGGFCGMNITTAQTYIETLVANTCVFIEIDSYNNDDIYAHKSIQCNYTLNAALSPSCVLPVKLLYFTGINEQGRIKLTWSSAEEQNAGKYVISRSVNGIDWTPINTTNARGNTTQTTDYMAYDENPIANTVNYYKLSEYDLNGAGGLMAQTFVSNTAGFPHFSVYPNPTNGMVTINISNFSVPSVVIEVVNVYGQTVYTSTIDLTDGSSLQQVDLSTLEAGVYFVKTSDGANFYKQRLVISK